MKHNLPYLLNLPPFLLKDIDENKISFTHKAWIIIFGKFISFVLNRTNGKFFCYFINLFFRKDGKIYFDGNNYFKESKNFQRIYYPNKRILRIVKDTKKHLNSIYKSYCLDKITFQENDLFIDCGANIGEVYLSLLINNVLCDYIAFEPDPESFDSLEKNILNQEENLYQTALSNSDGTVKFFLDSDGANSSIVGFGKKEYIETKAIKLDNFINNRKIKLFKIEAEGHEPEVLLGSLKSLENVEYISIDFGAERGIEQEMTIVKANNILYENNFKLVDFSEYRFIGLYKNNSSDESK